MSLADKKRRFAIIETTAFAFEKIALIIASGNRFQVLK
jgi:hypothetical protein